MTRRLELILSEELQCYAAPRSRQLNFPPRCSMKHPSNQTANNHAAKNQTCKGV
jgi:hypothetical protein